MRIALVMGGGAAGSAMRYLVGTWAVTWFGLGFPWGTFIVNAAGSFLIGLIATLSDEGGAIGSNARVLLVTGVLGGFTTFSAFSFESWRLFDDGATAKALVYIGATVLVGLSAAVGGIAVARVAT